ncbi:helix-turn-helix domain-containing protein [Pseudozobellia thermophila]|uniref:Transcriptional regulator, XRE family with cupin sensor n=1 Tax=Pseudozobellia thermophila TaxID=192903 RepID=A0A1M6B545_9FLAO|nr:helix-turn-helix transcriptional regulator [Pseudozobellia thermophila]SHI43851.1 transcriptional regulator, XRE family with cupin sensor [Pseudozobellia thermophila]
MEDYLIGIGKRIKEIRKEGGKTINEIAGRAGVTGGLISRIENGRTIPSLPVLLKIISSLEIEVTDFFNGMPLVNGANFIVSRKEDHTAIEKEAEAVGFSYTYIFGRQLTSLGFETVLLEVAPNSQREKVTTDAFEFKYILSGECYYRIGDDEVLLREGDSIFFDGRIPHVPVNRASVASKMLVMYFFI